MAKLGDHGYPFGGSGRTIGRIDLASNGGAMLGRTNVLAPPRLSCGQQQVGF